MEFTEPGNGSLRLSSSDDSDDSYEFVVEDEIYSPIDEHPTEDFSTTDEDSGTCCDIWPTYVSDCKKDKRRAVDKFIKKFTYTADEINNVLKDKITCISSTGNCSNEVVNGSGITWVAVHAQKSICMVAMWKKDAELVDGSFLRYKPIGEVLLTYMETVIYKIEDGSLKGVDEKAFGIISRICECVNVDEDLGAKYDVKGAIEYLREKINMHSIFTIHDTIQTAISAFQHLFRKKFEADEIIVIRLDETELFSLEMPSDFVKDYLVAINSSPEAKEKRKMEYKRMSPAKERKT